MKKYTLEFLSKEFEKHTKIAEENHQKDLRDHLKNFGAIDVPDHLKEQFSLPLALKTIVDTLIELKEPHK